MFLRNWAYLYSNLTDAERALEPAVAAMGRPYRAQMPFFDLHRIVDFALLEERTVIEVDGASHLKLEQKAKDLLLTLALLRKGWRVVRIWNEDAIRDPAGALSAALRGPEDVREELEERLRLLQDYVPKRKVSPRIRALRANYRTGGSKVPRP